MPVGDVLKQIKASKEARADAKKIVSLSLSNVVNSSRLNCQADPVFVEIYVFQIVVSEPFVPTFFIQELDKTVRFHTYFIIKCGNEIASTMCYKEIDKSVKLGKYYGHKFHDDVQVPIPQIGSVPEAYKFLYSYEVGVSSRDNESPQDYLSRVNQIHKLEFQVSETTKAIEYQCQPKKKYLYHQRLVEYEKTLKQLKGEKK